MRKKKLCILQEKQMTRAPNEYERDRFRFEKRRLSSFYHNLDAASRVLSPAVFIGFFLYYVLRITQREESACVGKSIFDI